MQFSLAPWDRNRPRRNPPLADCVVQLNGRTFGLRAQNGILFFRDPGDVSKTWAIASPLPPEIEGDKSKFEAFWKREFGRGNVARSLVPLVMLHVFNERQIPVFLRADGTGWARESWNRDDVPFSHRVSLHEWLEGSDETLLGELGGVEKQLKEKLSNLDFPTGTSADEDDELEWLCGSSARLGQILGWVCHLEARLWEEADVQSVQVSVSAENAFTRAHVASLEFLPRQLEHLRHTRFDVEPRKDELELSRYPGPDKACIALSNRFFTATDLALDENTPVGLFWQYTDQGAGRCSDAPYAPSIRFEFKRPSREEVEAAQTALRGWLEAAVSPGEVEEIVGDDAPRELKRPQD